MNTAKDLEMQLVKAKLETATLRFEELLIEKEKIELLVSRVGFVIRAIRNAFCYSS